MLSKKSTIDLADAIPDIWEALSADERILLQESYQVHTFKKNEIIHGEGERPICMMCLYRGKVKIYKEGVGGRNQIMRMIRPGQYFAYRAAFADEDYLTAAAAFEAATVVFLPLHIMRSLVVKNNNLAMFFIRLLAVDLGISDSRTVNLTQKHIRGRLAEALLFLLENYGLEDDESTIAIYLSREDLASLSNMTTSNAIRTLTIFSNEGLIAVDGRKIKLLDIDQLKRVSRHG